MEFALREYGSMSVIDEEKDNKVYDPDTGNLIGTLFKVND